MRFGGDLGDRGLADVEHRRGAEILVRRMPGAAGAVRKRQAGPALKQEAGDIVSSGRSPTGLTLGIAVRHDRFAFSFPDPGAMLTFALSTIAYFVASYFIRRTLAGMAIPRGLTRGLLIFACALAVACGVATLVDRTTSARASTSRLSAVNLASPGTRTTTAPQPLDATPGDQPRGGAAFG